MQTLFRILLAVPLALVSPIVLLISAFALVLADLVALLVTKKVRHDPKPRNHPASIVIPNWNGRELLEKYLPSVLAAIEDHPGSEVIVVDNGSTDGSANLVRGAFPQVKLVQLLENQGFSGASNAGFLAAVNDIVVLLNNDMRVDREFLAPLLDPFDDPGVFAVTCQIFFTDPARRREETGLTEAWWEQGGLRVGHRIDGGIREPYPCFYAGGGSSAFDRRKFLELGGFDELLAPFYLEDTDLGYQAWKRGWKVLYQPASIVFHEHRGTIGRRFTENQIQSVLKKNFLLWTWKNIHDWRKLGPHFIFAWASAAVSWIVGDSPERSSYMGIARAFLALPRALYSRVRARRLAEIDDTEAFRRPMGGWFRDRFARTDENLRVLFVTPYPICPPIHGGGVFMNQTVRELAKLCELHLIVLLDWPHERPAHAEIEPLCTSVEYMVRMEGRQKAIGSIEPHAVREFRNRDLQWLIHRQIYTRKIDVVQLEYMVLGQYAAGFARIPSIVFEHDVYFQSIARRLEFIPGVVERMQARFEYLRAVRWELRMLPKADRVQVCSIQNREYLESFLPELAGRIDDGFRAGIDTSRYEFRDAGRDPFTMLFLGSFRHAPNQEALQWFVRDVLSRVRAQEPRARLMVVGSDPPPRHFLPDEQGIELVGFVEDIREPLARYALFVCPILSGSGVRVKLLEAFAAGIPVVSTRLGAEGLATMDGEICALADDPETFAAQVVTLLGDPARAAAMADRARDYVVRERDLRTMTSKLVECYREEIGRLRGIPAPRAHAAR